MSHKVNAFSRICVCSCGLEVTVDDERRKVRCSHGFGGGHHDPARGGQIQRLGVNRNLLVDSTRIDPLSQTPAFNSTHGWVEPVHAEQTPAGRDGTGGRAMTSTP